MPINPNDAAMTSGGGGVPGAAFGASSAPLDAASASTGVGPVLIQRVSIVDDQGNPIGTAFVRVDGLAIDQVVDRTAAERAERMIALLAAIDGKLANLSAQLGGQAYASLPANVPGVIASATVGGA